MDEKLSDECIYTVSSASQLNSFDRKVISLLYQPIIGHQASALYFTLWSEVEIDRIYTSNSYIKRLIKMMNIDVQSLKNSFNLLEALGLIKSFTKYDKEQCYYHFTIQSPGSPKYFFSNPLLVKNLLDCLGNDEFNKTKRMFYIVDKDYSDYKDVSKKYKEVFSLNHDPRVINNNEIFKDYTHARVESDIDLSLVKEGLREYNLHTILIDKKIKYHLEMLMLSYKITSLELVDSIVEAHINDTLDLNELERIVKMKTIISETKTSLDLVYIKDEKANNKYAANSVYEYLNKYYQSLNLNIELFKKLEATMKDYTLNNGVYNVLIEFVIGRTRSLNINYLRSIALEWQESNISTVDLALKRVNEITTKSPSKAKGSYAKQQIGNLDNWYQESNEKELSKDELEVLRKSLNR